MPSSYPRATCPSIKKIITDIAVSQQAALPSSVTMSPSPVSSPLNGHISPVANTVAVQLLDPEPSDSDLSDAPVADIESPTSNSPDKLDQVAADGRAEDFDDHSSSSDQDAPNDGDFDDVAEPASPVSHSGLIGATASAASSDDSRDASKRKAAPMDEEEFIRDNPQLYGLRRSVRRTCLVPWPIKLTSLTVPPTATTQNCTLSPSPLFYRPWSIC